jgi:hypothetical protein
MLRPSKNKKMDSCQTLTVKLTREQVTLPNPRLSSHLEAAPSSALLAPSRIWSYQSFRRSDHPVPQVPTVFRRGVCHCGILISQDNGRPPYTLVPTSQHPSKFHTHLSEITMSTDLRAVEQGQGGPTSPDIGSIIDATYSPHFDAHFTQR